MAPCASHVYGKQKRKPTHTTKHATTFGGAIFEASILVPPANVEHSGESRTALLHRTYVKLMGAGKISPKRIRGHCGLTSATTAPQSWEFFQKISLENEPFL